MVCPFLKLQRVVHALGSPFMSSQVAVLGIDLGKNWFHVIGVDAVGRPVLRKKLNRSQLHELAGTVTRCVVAMESCPGSQFWGRQFAEQGHDVRLIPAQFVKPYVKSNKNDFNDALAIAEAASRATIPSVPLKNIEQLELQATHRVRQRLVADRTATINQMRALLLEQGIVVGVGRKRFAGRLADVLREASDSLSPRMRLLLTGLRERWLSLDADIKQLTDLLTRHALQSELCQSVVTVPGIGPMIATATVAAVGNGRMLRRGRDMAAWLGLVPRQFSTGGRSSLGSISKRGNVHLRQLFIQGAQVLYTHLARDRSSLGVWLRAVAARTHRNVAVVALANKLVRICWKVLSSGQQYQPYPARVS
jgi:transposase